MFLQNVTNYKSRWRNTPEASHLCQHQCENIRSCTLKRIVGDLASSFVGAKSRAVTFH